MSSGFGFAAFTGGVTWIGEPRKTKAGKTVINISVAASEDKRNEDGSWTQEGNGKYYESVTAFGRLADNIVKTFKPGDRVVVLGHRHPKPDYTDSKGNEHVNENQVVAESVGPDLNMWPWQAVREKKSESAPAAAPAAATRPTQTTAPAVSSNDDDDEDW